MYVRRDGNPSKVAVIANNNATRNRILERDMIHTSAAGESGFLCLIYSYLYDNSLLKLP